MPILKSFLRINLILIIIFCFNLKETQAISVVDNKGPLQTIKLQQDDLNKWIEVPNEFTSVAVKSKNKADLALLLNPSDPLEKEVEFEEDEYSELLFTNPTQKFLLTTKKKKVSEDLTVYLLDTREDKNIIKERKLLAGNNDFNGLRIISRGEWGADENLRYYEPDDVNNTSSSSSSVTAACQKKIDAYPDEYKYSKVIETENDNYLKWPLQYSPEIKKIVLHHTGENNITNERPSDEMVRAIYYYHTIVKGWGDIGYHYIVGKDGEIFEGKAGGDKVVGAHVYCNNIGTIGVSVMGNFELEETREKQINSLEVLLAQITKYYNIDPDGSSVYHGESFPNIVGHRDLGATACPGKNLYIKLPQIRKEVAEGFTYNFSEETSIENKEKDFAAEVSDSIATLNLAPTHQKTLTFEFKNTGKQSWNDTTWLHIALNSNKNAWADTVVPDKKYVAADMQESSVKPGEIATFEVTINAGYNKGFYLLEFAPVVNNKYKLSSAAILQPINISEANYTYEFVGAEHPPNPFYAEQAAKAVIQLKNTGNIIWRNFGDNKIYLGTTQPQDRKSLFSSDGRHTRLGYLNEREVYPGQIGTFIMPLTAPENAGIYVERFAPVIEGMTWLKDKGMEFRIIVKEPTHQIQFTTKSNLLNLNPGTEENLSISYKNLSDVDWSEDEIYFMLAGDYETLGIEDNTIQLTEPLLKDKKGSFKVNFTTPLQNGLYTLTIVPVIRGKKFENASPLTLRIIVKKPNASGEVIDNLAKTLELDLNKTEVVTIKVKNTSNFNWTQENASLVPLSTNSRLYVAEKWISKQVVSYPKEEIVEPNEIATFTLYLKPKYRGYYADVFKIKITDLGYATGVLIPLRVKAGDFSAIKTNSTTTNTSTNNTTKIEEKDLIRVKLSIPNENSIKLTSEQNYTIEDNEQKQLFSVSKGEQAIVKRSGNYIHVQVGSVNKVAEIVRFISNDEGIMEISSWEHRPSWNQNLNDNLFRGTIEIRNIDDKLAVINELPLENYLKGIAEVSNSDPTEKLKTMAVLSRTYALFYLQEENEKFPGQPYDASDNPDIFQKYLGYGLEKRSPNFTEAIEKTKDEIVKYNGELVKTPYFNQSNGKTLSAEEVWGWTHTPYLISIDDPDCLGLKQKGHGVGLSGYGASKRAERGDNYKKIIKYYYKNVSVEKM